MNMIFLGIMIALKEWFTQKWKCTHSQAIQDVDEFVSSSEQGRVSR